MVKETTTSQSLYVAAKGYLQAIKVVRQSLNNTAQAAATLFLPMHLLMGFSVELYLKACIRHAGKSDQDLKDLGHDLKALYNEACNLGLPGDLQIQALVNLLHPYHVEYSYRYMPAQKTYKNTDADISIAALQILDIKTDTIVGASAAYNLLPGHSWK